MSTETQKVPSDNPNGYCRLCFSDRNLVPLFPDDAQPRQSLMDLIYEGTGIEIKQSANFPCSICWRCAVALEDFQMFRQRSLAHDAIIQSRYSTVFEIRMIEEKVDWEPAGCSTEVPSNNQVESDDDEDCVELVSDSKSDGKRNNSDQIEGTNSSDANTNDNVSDGNKRITCHYESCDKDFLTQQSLYVHYKEQHSERCRPFQCHLCHANFKRKTHLEDHISSHTGEPRYNCKDCGKFYAKAKSLIHHRKAVHAYKPAARRSRSSNPDENPFKCNFCPKAFKHRPSLNFHVKTHYDKLTFQCEVCGARFANEQGKLVHKGKFHPVDPSSKKHPFACKMCPRFFEQRGYLKLHMKFIHHSVVQDEQDESEAEDMPAAMEQSDQQDPDDDVGINETDEQLHPTTIKFEVVDDVL